MGIFSKKQEPQTFEEYVEFFDNIPAERRNKYLKYIESFATMKDSIFTSYTSMTDFYDYEGYRLDNMARAMKAPKREGHLVYMFLGNFYGFNHIHSLKRELVKKNGEVRFNLNRFSKCPAYFDNQELYFTINPSAGRASESTENLSIIAANSKTPKDKKETYFYIEEKSETVFNVSQYWDDSIQGVERVNEAGKFISNLLDGLKRQDFHSIDFTTEPKKLEVLDRLLDEAKALTAPKTTESTTTAETTKDKK